MQHWKIYWHPFEKIQVMQLNKKNSEKSMNITKKSSWMKSTRRNVKSRRLLSSRKKRLPPATLKNWETNTTSKNHFTPKSINPERIRRKSLRKPWRKSRKKRRPLMICTLRSTIFTARTPLLKRKTKNFNQITKECKSKASLWRPRTFRLVSRTLNLLIY